MGIGEDTGGRTVRPYSLSCTVCSVNMHRYSRLILAQGKDKTSRMVAEPKLYSSIFCVNSMALHQEVLHAITASVVSALQQAGVTPHNAPQTDTNARKKSGIDTKAVRIRDFDGTPSSWEGWAHSFKSAIRSTCPEALAIWRKRRRASPTPLTRYWSLTSSRTSTKSRPRCTTF